MLGTTAWIDLAALRHNFAEAERHAAGRAVIGVVKADAYGHGATGVARELVEAGCPELAVATVPEGVELREAGLEVPILVLGGCHDRRTAARAAAHGLTAVVHDERRLADHRAAAAAAGRPLPLQIEVDTGMARMGVPLARATALARAIAEDPALELDGIFTHLARADEPDLEPSRQQLERFGTLLAALREAGIAARRTHVANSAGLLATAELAEVLPAEVNAVRPGLMLYGVVPAAHLADRVTLAPVMTLSSRIVALRDVPAGTPVGYAGSWVAPRATRIATLDVGYADGIPWSLAGATAELRERRVSLVGRISMDLVTLDVGPEAEGEAQLGDSVILFGHGGPRVAEVATRAGTLPYEILVRVGPRIPRMPGRPASPA